ncbi:MAG: hypothetical protein AB1589_07425 [Cyanobacteriota bacterium]
MNSNSELFDQRMVIEEFDSKIVSAGGGERTVNTQGRRFEYESHLTAKPWCG